MKKSTKGRFQPYISMRKRVWRTGDCYGIYLPKPWCLQQGIDQLAEIKMRVFRDVIMIFPPGKHNKPSPQETQLLIAASMKELFEEMEKTIKDAQQAFKGFKGRPTRGKRRS